MKYYKFLCDVKHNGIYYKAGKAIPAGDAACKELEALGGIVVTPNAPPAGQQEKPEDTKEKQAK